MRNLKHLNKMVSHIAVVAWVALAFSVAALAQDQSAIEAGEQLYDQHCAECHGEKLRSSGVTPDLRTLSANDRARFDAMVKDGKDQMPSWDGILTAENLDQLWAYIRAHAR